MQHRLGLFPITTFLTPGFWFFDLFFKGFAWILFGSIVILIILIPGVTTETGIKEYICCRRKNASSIKGQPKPKESEDLNIA